MRVGDLNQFQLFHEGALQMSSVATSGLCLKGTLTSCDPVYRIDDSSVTPTDLLH